ncbi:hypothetical protein ED733_007114 [Metarhizium rileyi]|uniref:Uncharacterized protein n=1 Tax=Metarhizium rileyi (strain RCEF 4871) TaxID=1649241 RepID=A0A5C6GC64_METRR|nr:hypothetical protein ED733_007114 [Metarhizium rileyi]
MRPDSDSGNSAQWTDITETINKEGGKKPTDKCPQELANPFSDPIGEGDVLQLQDFKYRAAAESKPGGFVSEHPSWKPSQVAGGRISHYLKPILQDDDNANSKWETVAADEDVFLKPSIRLRQRVENGRLAFPAHEILSRSRQAVGRVQHRNTAFLPTTSSRNLAPPLTMDTSSPPEEDSPWPRASSVYEDDAAVLKTTDQSHQQSHHPQSDTSRLLTKKRPATLGFDRNARDELVASYSKSSSRASNDPFKFDGADYSIFLQPSAEKEVSKALCRSETFSEAPSTAIYSRQTSERHSLGRLPSTNEHPLSKLEELVVDDAATTEKDAGGDWQTVTTEHAPYKAMELTLRLDRGVGSSLADVSDVSEFESFDHFVGATADCQNQRQTRLGGNMFAGASKARTMSPRFSQPICKTSRAHSARAVATVRHLSRLSTDNSNKPRFSSKLCEMRKPARSYNSLDSDPEQNRFDGNTPASPDVAVEVVTRHAQWAAGPRHGQDSQEMPGHVARGESSVYRSRDFAHNSPLVDYNLPSLPFPLISLQEAALRQSQGTARGEADHNTSRSVCASNARSGTISTISTYGPRTPITPVGDISDISGLPHPPQVYHRHSPARAILPYEPTRGQLHSSDIIDTNSGSFFRTSLPTNTSPISARFFRLSGFSARTRERRQDLKRTSGTHNLEHSFFTPSETDLIHSAREDILCRRRRCPEEDANQQRVFLVIFVLAVFFPLIGVLALYGKFDATIAWYDDVEAGG